jgi:hypothetical protein
MSEHKTEVPLSKDTSILKPWFHDKHRPLSRWLIGAALAGVAGVIIGLILGEIPAIFIGYIVAVISGLGLVILRLISIRLISQGYAVEAMTQFAEAEIEYHRHHGHYTKAPDLDLDLVNTTLLEYNVKEISSDGKRALLEVKYLRSTVTERISV